MIENLHGRNYELAKAEADKVDEQIIEVLQVGHCFRVEAGAGSGKTYSLNNPNLASFYVTRLVLTPTLGGGCYFGLDWFYSFH